MKLAKIMFFMIFVLILAGSAVAETFEAEDVTYYTADAESGTVFTQIFVSMPPSSVTHAELETDTFEISYDLEILNIYSYQIDIEVYNILTGETLNGTDTHYHIPGYYPWTSVEVGDCISSQCTVTAGGMLLNGTVTTPSTFTFSADAESNIVWTGRDSDKLDEENSWSDFILDIMEKVPYVGSYIVTALRFSGTIVSLFFHYGWLVLDNIVLVFVIFETGIELHMLAVLKQYKRQNKAKRSMEAIKVFANDHRVAIEFFIGTTVKVLELVYSAAKAIGSWVPFT